MKREDISRIFPDATKEQINEIMNLNGADVNQARGDSEQLQKDLTAAQNDLIAARNTISELEKVKGDAEKLQGEIDKYKQDEINRQQAEQQAAAQAKIEQRFGKVIGERKFINDHTRRGVLEDFGKALADETNAGKSDADIFAALTKDLNLFVSQNPPTNMPPFGNVDPGDNHMAAMRSAMGLPAKQ